MRIGAMGNIGDPPPQPEVPEQTMALRDVMEIGRRMLQTSLQEQGDVIDVAPAMWDQAEAEFREKVETFIQACRPAPKTAAPVGSEEPSDSHSVDPTDEAESPEEK